VCSAEFLVHDVRVEERDVLVSGIVNKGEIRRGDICCAARPEEQPEQAVSLSIVRITAYRRELDELPTGMSGELQLIGKGANLLKEHDMLEFRRTD
jgi:hypothetical protein